MFERVLIGVAFLFFVFTSPTVADVTPPAVVHGAKNVSFEAHAFGGYIDSRRESTNGSTVNRGLDRVRMVFTEPVFDLGSTNGGTQNGVLTTTGFTVTETGGGTPPDVTAVNTTDNTSVEVVLSRIITVQEWTTIIAEVEDAAGNPIETAGDLGDGVVLERVVTEAELAEVRHGVAAGSGDAYEDILIQNLGDLGPGVNEPDRIDVAFLPCDIDQSGTVAPLDNTRFRMMIDGVFHNSMGVDEDYADIDRNGLIDKRDLKLFRKLFVGTSPATRVWLGQSLNNPRP